MNDGENQLNWVRGLVGIRSVETNPDEAVSGANDAVLLAAQPLGDRNQGRRRFACRKIRGPETGTGRSSSISEVKRSLCNSDL